MKIVIIGATGMIGHGVLLHALDHPQIERVLSVGRKALDLEHPKLHQIVHRDFEDFQPIASQLEGLDACFWCLGTASSGVDEAKYTRITHDFTMAAAQVLPSHVERRDRKRHDRRRFGHRRKADHELKRDQPTRHRRRCFSSSALNLIRTLVSTRA